MKRCSVESQSFRTSAVYASGSTCGHGAFGTNVISGESACSKSFLNVEKETADNNDKRWATSCKKSGGESGFQAGI